MTDNPTLRQRAGGAEVAKRSDLGTQIKQMQEQFAMAMPRGLEAAQLVRDALTALRQTPKLAECDPQSVLGGLMTCAQLGLRVGVLGHAWLLPFYDGRSRSMKAQLVIGYQGLVELAYRSDKIGSLIARTVYEHDVFHVEFGTEDRLVHEPDILNDRGRPIAYYAVAHLKNGRPVFYVMSHQDMLKYRDNYAMAKTKEGNIVGPWRDQFEGMAHKTCARQLSKWLPKSTDLARALEVDGGIRLDALPETDPSEATSFIEGEIVEEATPDGHE